MVNLGDDLRPGQRQQFIVALYINALAGRMRDGRRNLLRYIGSAIPAVLRFRELVLLNHGPRGPIKDHDALGQLLAKRGKR